MKAKTLKLKTCTTAMTVGYNGGDTLWFGVARTENEGFTMGLSPSDARTLAAWLLEAATAVES
jgi:hypothetical protein